MKPRFCIRVIRATVALLALFVVQAVQAESVDLGVIEAHRKIECGFAITNDSTMAWFVRGARRAPRTLSRAVTLRRDDGKPFKVLSSETKPRKWGDVKIVDRPLGGCQVIVENIDPDAVRQFSKKPYLEVKTDLPENGILKVPLQVE